MPGHVEGDHPEPAGDLRIVEQRAVLAAVRPGGVQAEQRAVENIRLFQEKWFKSWKDFTGYAFTLASLRIPTCAKYEL